MKWASVHAPGAVGAVAVEVDHPVDVEAGVLGLGLPQRGEATAQLGIVEQAVAALEAEIERRDGDRFELIDADLLAADLAVEHHHDRTGGVGDRADEPVAHERQAVLGGESTQRTRSPRLYITPRAGPLGDDGVAQRAPLVERIRASRRSAGR